MHPSVMAYGAEHLTPELLRNADVLEVGSYDYNGSLRELCMKRGASRYLGIDIRPGPNVDIVMGAETLQLGRVLIPCTVVVCTEMLEHARYWKLALTGIRAALDMGGHLLLTCRGPGMVHHPHPEDHWRFTPDVISRALRSLGFTVLDLRSDAEEPGVLSFSRVAHKGSPIPDGLEAEPAPNA